MRGNVLVSILRSGLRRRVRGRASCTSSGGYSDSGCRQLFTPYGGDGRGALATQKTVRQDVVDPTIASHGGRFVKTTDDELRFIGYAGDACRLLFDGTMAGVSDTWKCEQHNCRFSSRSVRHAPGWMRPHAKEILANLPDYTDRSPVRSNLPFLLPETSRTTIARPRKGGRSCH